LGDSRWQEPTGEWEGVILFFLKNKNDSLPPFLLFDLSVKVASIQPRDGDYFW
jgi:hypothetical protein